MDKKHALIFQTESGQFIIETDDIQEVSNLDWFREFLRLPEKPMVLPELPRQPMPQPVPQMRQPVQQVPKTIFDINPDEMTKTVWDSLDGEQQKRWMQHFGIKE